MTTNPAAGHDLDDLDDDVEIAPRGIVYASTALCVIGLAIAAYLTYEHFTSSTSLSCPDTGAINCLKVTTSSYSSFLGVPVALGGLMYYVVMVALCQPLAWCSNSETVTRLRLAASGLGVVSILYLVWAELFKIDAICLWCTGVHIVTVVLFITLVFEYALRPAAV